MPLTSKPGRGRRLLFLVRVRRHGPGLWRSISRAIGFIGWIDYVTGSEISFSVSTFRLLLAAIAWFGAELSTVAEAAPLPAYPKGSDAERVARRRESARYPAEGEIFSV